MAERAAMLAASYPLITVTIYAGRTQKKVKKKGKKGKEKEERKGNSKKFVRQQKCDT